MLTVHHLNQSRSQRVLWALEELNLPYQIVRYQRGADMLAPDSLKKSIRWVNRRLLRTTATLSLNPGRFLSICKKSAIPKAALNRRILRENCSIASGCTMPKAR